MFLSLTHTVCTKKDKPPSSYSSKMDPNATKAHAVEDALPSDKPKAPMSGEVDELIDRITGKKRGGEPQILLEVWSDEDYLGECVLPQLSTLERNKGVRTFKIGRPDDKVARPDHRKTRFMNDSSVGDIS